MTALIFLNLIEAVIVLSFLIWSIVQWYAYLNTHKQIAQSLDLLCDYKRMELYKNHDTDRIDL
ncbi:hypothetical protein [Neisseria sicca]|uniref:hypothetical protein n=1 Tax=Neisseria sicca TaxID=490 RepID=UPI003C77BAD5